MQTEALLGKHFGYIDELENCVNMQKDSDRWFIATRDRCPVHPYSRLNTMLAIFDFQGQSVRTAQDEQGDTWFCLSDLLQAMNSKSTIADTKSSITDVFNERHVINLPLVNNTGGTQITVFISEDATTFLVSRSRTKIGKQLCRWIYAEVLPSIRKTGSYSVTSQPQINTTTDRYDELNQVLAVLEQHFPKRYIRQVVLENMRNFTPAIALPEYTERALSKEEILLSKIYNKAQVLGRITPRQVQQWFTNRHNKVTADNARAYLRKLCELGLGYLETDGTFVVHIDNEIMAQLAI